MLRRPDFDRRGKPDRQRGRFNQAGLFERVVAEESLCLAGRGHQFVDPAAQVGIVGTSNFQKAFCALDEPTLELLKMAMNELKLSARAYDRILKVARTIADLAGSERLTSEHISEAIQSYFFANFGYSSATLSSSQIVPEGSLG